MKNCLAFVALAVAAAGGAAAAAEPLKDDLKRFKPIPAPQVPSKPTLPTPTPTPPIPKPGPLLVPDTTPKH